MAASDAELKIIASLDDKVTEAVRKLIGEVGALSDEAKKAFDDMRVAAAKAKEKVEDTGTAADETAKSTKKVGEEGKKAGDSIGKAFADSAIQFAATAVSVNLLVEQIKKFLDETAKVEVALARIQASNNLTAEAAEDLGDKLSVVFGLFRDVATREEILASAQVLLNEKFATGQDVVFKVADALGFARTQGITLAESTKLLVDVSGAFVNASTNSIEVLSKLRQVQKGTASDFKILAEGFDRIGNTAQAAGVRFDDLLSAFTVLRNAGTSERESLKFLEVILQNLQVNAAEVDKQFRNIGKTFDAQTISTAGLSQTIGNLYSGIKAGGGDVQEQFKKIFGGQAQANAAFAIGVERSGEYFAALNNLSKASQEYFKDVSLVSRASGEAFRFTEAIDIVNNVRGVYNALSGDLLEFYESNLKFQKAQAEGSAAATRGVIGLQFETSIAADKAKELGAAGSEAATSFSEKLREARPDIIAFFDALAGKQADAEIEKVKKFANDLREQAKKFSELGVPEFSGAELEATLRRIGELESKLVEEIFAKRTALADEAAKKEAQRLLDLKNKAAAASQAQADRDRAASDEKAARDLRLEEEKRRQEEQTILLRQQAELQAYQANLQRIRETAALAQQLVQEGIAGGAGERQFFADIAEQVQPFAAQILELEGLLANTILSEAEASAVQARIEGLKNAVREISAESVKGGEAFDKGFTASLQRFSEVASNDFKNGAELATASTNAFTSSFSGLLNDIVLGTKSAGEAFKDFIRNFISGLVQAINQLIATKIAASILSALVPGFAAAPAAPVAAAGGVVGGRLLATGSAGSGPFNGPPVAGAKFFEKGGIMAGTMLAAASGLPMRAYAQGGVATEPQIAVFGEGRGAEAFVPLPGPNRGIPVEFQNTPAAMAREQAQPMAPSINVQVDYNPSIQALDGRSTRDVLLREARAIGDIVAGEIASGANRGLIESVRAKR